MTGEHHENRRITDVPTEIQNEHHPNLDTTYIYRFFFCGILGPHTGG
jgi:hypothetical protein